MQSSPSMKIREDSFLMPHLDDYLYGQFSGRKKKKKNNLPDLPNT